MIRRMEAPGEVRAAIRAGDWTGPTAGLAPEYTQANLVVLPEADAFGFLRFCLRNPKPCPVLEVCEPGSPEPVGHAAGAVTGEFDLAADPSGAIAYDKSQGNVEAGTVTIKLTNESSLEHNVAVAQGSRQLGVSPTIKGSETELKVDLPAGTYEFYCTIPGHRAAGMQGTLTAR